MPNLADLDLRKQIRRNLKLDTRIAILGDNNNPARVRVPGRSSYVYVRYPASDNNTASLGWPTIVKMVVNITEAPGTPVVVGYDLEGELAVLTVSGKALETNGTPAGAGVVNNPVNQWVDLGYSPYLRTQPLGANAPLYVAVMPFKYVDSAKIWHDFNGVDGGVDLSSYRPGSTNQWCLAGLFLKTDDTVEVVASTAQDLSEPLTADDIQECITGSTDLSIFIGCWQLKYGQTVMADSDLFIDGRQWINIPALDHTYILIRDEKAQNTAGGTFTSGAWQTRTLNTEASDAGGYASLSSNQITLAAGTYRVTIRCPAYLCDQHQARLYNISDSAVTLIGTSEYSPAGGAVPTASIIMGRFTITASKIFEVQHRCTTTRATDGYGIAANFTTEVYTIAEIVRE